jgi:hypothetical protein
VIEEEQNRKLSIHSGELNDDCCRPKFPIVYKLTNGNIGVTDKFGHYTVEIDPSEALDFDLLRATLGLEDEQIAAVPSAIQMLTAND